MTRTIIGVFKSLDGANAAMATLVSRGLSDVQHMRLSANTSDYGGETTVSGTVVAPAYREDAPAGHTQTGVLANIENFLTNLFGSSVQPMPEPHYQEPIRSGSALLVVDVDDEAQLQNVELALERAGAIDVNGRVPSWQTEGYIGPDGVVESPLTPSANDLAPQGRDGVGPIGIGDPLSTKEGLK